MQYIRKLYYLEGWSIRKISRQLPVSRPTIRRMLLDAEIPKYNLTKERPAPVMGEYMELVGHWLKEDESAPVKQRHTATRIFERLVEEYGFSGSYSTVRRAVAKLRPSLREAFIPLTVAPGEQFQVDFGHAKVYIAGKLVKVCLFCMRLKYSLVPYVVAFPTERLEAFLEGHVRGFMYLGGVPKTGLYDNAKTQVVKILNGPEREEHESFSSLRSHYLFNSQFCRPGHGNEKGTIESLVKYIRIYFFVPVPSFESWDELNKALLAWCDKEKAKHYAKWQEEQKALRSLPVLFCAARLITVKVNRYSLVTIDRNRYSVPTEYVGQNLIAKLYVDRIEVLDKTEVIASHTRAQGRDHTLLELKHYLTALSRKPRAVLNATVVRELPRAFHLLKERMEEAHSTGYKDFLEVLLRSRQYPLNQIEGAIMAIGPQKANADALRAYLETRRSPEPQTPKPPFTEKPLITAQDTECYDRLLREVGL